MSVSAVRWLVAAFMLVFLLATTWPGAMLFNQATPLVLGLPFNLFVIAALITFGLILLGVLYLSENRTQD